MTLTLAIALNATVFTVMDAMVFRGLPLVQDNERLVYMQVRRPTGSWNVDYQDFEAWRGQANSFEGLGFRGGGTAAFCGPGHAASAPWLTTNV